MLGLRIVKKTINQTDQTTYHIFYGDERASYGNNISFFEYRGRPDGRAGADNVHRIGWRLGTEAALDFWERRIADEDLVAERGESSLRFADQEGLEHELAVIDTGDEPLTGHRPRSGGSAPASSSMLPGAATPRTSRAGTSGSSSPASTQPK